MQKKANKRRKPYAFYTYLTQQMFDELIWLQKGTHFQKLSDLYRHILLGKKVVAQYINGPPDTLLFDITVSFKELKQKCSAIKQLTGKTFGENDPEALMADAVEARRIYKEVNDLLGPMHTQITEISRRWLPDEEPD